MPLPLLALALASFGIGTTEFVIMGLLPEVASDLRVTIPAAGLLVSGYALGVVVGAPILAALTSRLARKTTLLLLMGLFTAGNLCCALAPSYMALMAARIATAFCHGTFFGIASVVAADLVAPNKRAHAMALMFAGLTLANVLGVPAGTALGQMAGWRTTFGCVVGLGIVAEIAIAVWVPATGPAQGTRFVDEMRVLGRPQVLLAMAISILVSASLFTVFTYIAPILRDVTGVSPSGVTGILVLFGAGLTIGNLAGGRLADWRLMPTVMVTLALVIGVVALFSVTSRSVVPAAITIFVWGVCAFALVPPLQMRVVDEASGAPNLASILNQGAFNLGNAAGAWLGGLLIAAGLPYTMIPFAGAALAAAALALTVFSSLLEQSGRRPAAAAA